MAIFIIVPLGNNIAELDLAVETNIPESNRYRLQNDAGWLIEHSGTAIDASNKVGITGQPEGVRSPVGSAIVNLITNYYGRGNTDMWDWMRVRLES